MRRVFFSASAILVSFLLSLVSLIPARAASSGDLIKASSPAVYYLGKDGKRYVFPNEKTYKTWYADFSSVKTVTDAELAAYPIGGNVTVKPGVRLVKITTDPKTYYVADHGALRWVKTEALAQAIYGKDWAKNVDDVPDAFFINYTVTDPLVSLDQYQNEIVSGPTRAFYTINDNLTLPAAATNPPASTTSTAPAATSTTPATPNPYSASITLSKTAPYPGQVFNVLASAAPSASVTAMKIFFDGVLKQTCERTPCSTDITMPLSASQPKEVKTEITWMDNHAETRTATVAVGNQADLLTLTMRPEVKPGDTQEFVLDVDSFLIAKTIDIYLDGVDIRGCNNVQRCRYLYQDAATTGTVRHVYAIMADANGKQYRSATKTYSIVTNDHPRFSFLTSKNVLSTAESIEVTMMASDDDLIAWTEVWLDGTLLKRCASSSCTITAGPWSQARTLEFSGRAEDQSGLIGSGTSTTIVVQ